MSRQREDVGARVVAAMIGRERELDAVARFIERVLNGPVALAIEGEPGIGKTTLWLEAVRAADERGYRVLQARPAQARRSFPTPRLAISSAARSTR